MLKVMVVPIIFTNKLFNNSNITKEMINSQLFITFDLQS